jgi:hypothetical protein
LLGLAGTLILVAFQVGCASPTTTVDFVGPSGATMILEGKSYTLPATVALTRPSKKNAVIRQEVAFFFPAVPTKSGPSELSVEGIIEVYGYDETDVDRLATNTCELSDAQLQKAMEGYAAIFDGISASQQKLYHMIIGRKKYVSEGS